MKKNQKALKELKHRQVKKSKELETKINAVCAYCDEKFKLVVPRDLITEYYGDEKDRVKYTYFKCPACGAHYRTSLTDSAINKMIKERKKLAAKVTEILKRKDFEKHEQEYKTTLEKDVLLENKIKENVQKLSDKYLQHTKQPEKQGE